MVNLAEWLNNKKELKACRVKIADQARSIRELELEIQENDEEIVELEQAIDQYKLLFEHINKVSCKISETLDFEEDGAKNEIS